VQSGHIILTDSATTGDGQLTAARFIRALYKSGVSAGELASRIPRFPQTMINVPVPEALKRTVADTDSVKAVEAEIRALFGEEGRILVRPSGTEPLVRVMAEGRDAETVRKMAEKADEAIRLEAEKSK
jgi:phosphoglucosamine mutase